MPENHRQRVRRIFLELAELETAQRPAALERWCGEDSALRAEVEALLKADAEAGEFMASPTAGGTARPAVAAAPAQEQAGASIGRYKLLEQIGEGGMGTIWMAEQREPVKRRVALKIIKLGMDTKQVIARFEAERQALAMMDHPHIAKVLDAGATDTGRPYFVMEYIKGIPILEYCDKEKVDTQARLELFTKVCHAIQHAHQKGIIHRDIKPSNVLVTLHDGVPMPKVIDFGIAKATNSELTTKTLFTEHRQMIGTPAYMSPEQAEMSGLDIDTRSDVYSLGVLLYELLTGTTPFDMKALLESGYAEMLRAIREDEPHKPSTRISSLGDTGTRTAQQRRVEVKRLSLLLRGDLDWIVMKCLEKDRARRYDTANGLAADIVRHLQDEPVSAGAPSAGYKLRKFVKRNRGAVLAGALVALALVLGMIGTGVSLQRAVRAESNVRTQLAATETAQKAEKARADELEKVSEFQASMLSQVDPTTAGVRLSEDVNRRFAAALEKMKVPDAERAKRVDQFRQDWARVNTTDAATLLIDATVLKPAVAAIGEQFKDQPLVDARLRQALADRYRDLGLYADAEPLQASALATRRRELGEEHPLTLASLNATGELLLAEGKLHEAETTLRDALERRRRILGDEHPETLVSLHDVGSALDAQHRRAEAEPIFRDVLEKRRRVLGEDHPDTIASLGDLGSLLEHLGWYDGKEHLDLEGGQYLREAMVRSTRVLGADHPDTIASIGRMGDVLRNQSHHDKGQRNPSDPKLAEAERDYREALAKSRRVLGEDHPSTFEFLGKLGNVLSDMEKYDEAIACFREALAKSRRVLGDDHPDTIDRMFRLGVALTDGPEGIALWREATTNRRRVRGETHADTVSAVLNFAQVLRDRGQPKEAEALLAESVAAHLQAFPTGNPKTVLLLWHHARHLDQLGRLDEAEAEARRAVRICLEHPGVDSFDTEIQDWSLWQSTQVAQLLSAILAERGRVDEAIAVRREMLAAQRRGIPSGSVELCDLLESCAYQFVDFRKLECAREAESLLRESLEIRVQKNPPPTWTAYEIQSLLGEAIVTSVEVDPVMTAEARVLRLREAEPLLTQSYANVVQDKTVEETGHGYLRRTALERLVHLCAVWDKTEPDKGHNEKLAEWKAKLAIENAASKQR